MSVEIYTPGQVLTAAEIIASFGKNLATSGGTVTGAVNGTAFNTSQSTAEIAANTALSTFSHTYTASAPYVAGTSYTNFNTATRSNANGETTVQYWANLLQLITSCSSTIEPTLCAGYAQSVRYALPTGQAGTQVPLETYCCELIDYEGSPLSRNQTLETNMNTNGPDPNNQRNVLGIFGNTNGATAAGYGAMIQSAGLGSPVAYVGSWANIGWNFNGAIIDTRYSVQGASGYAYMMAQGQRIGWGNIGGTIYNAIDFDASNNIRVQLYGQPTYLAGTRGMRSGRVLSSATTCTTADMGSIIQINGPSTISIGLPVGSTLVSDQVIGYYNPTRILQRVNTSADPANSGSANNVIGDTGSLSGTIDVLPGCFVLIRWMGGAGEFIVFERLCEDGMLGPKMTVAELQATQTSGMQGISCGALVAYAKNGCANASQTTGNGKGCPVYLSYSGVGGTGTPIWCAHWSGVAVTA